MTEKEKKAMKKKGIGGQNVAKKATVKCLS